MGIIWLYRWGLFGPFIYKEEYTKREYKSLGAAGPSRGVGPRPDTRVLKCNQLQLTNKKLKNYFKMKIKETCSKDTRKREIVIVKLTSKFSSKPLQNRPADARRSAYSDFILIFDKLLDQQNKVAKIDVHDKIKRKCSNKIPLQNLNYFNSICRK